MKAELIFQRKFTLTCSNGRIVAVFMDVFRLPKGHPSAFPDGYRFSWIAYDTENESARVLFDCHDPKGPHVHLDSDHDGTSFRWESIDAAYGLFFDRIKERFGEFEIAEEE